MLAGHRKLGRSGRKIRPVRTLYQLEYHMKTPMKARFVGPSAAAAAAVLACWLTFGGSQVVRAGDPDILFPPRQDTASASAIDVQALEQRVIYLEETVAALTESWQHIDTHRLCVSDDSGAETCITKPQLDALLLQSAQAGISRPSVPQASASAAAGPVEIAATRTLPAAGPSAAGGEAAGAENVPPDQDPETTGTAKVAPAGSSTGAAVLSYPKVEIYEEPAARSDN
jgi:hypothetical protein